MKLLNRGFHFIPDKKEANSLHYQTPYADRSPGRYLNKGYLVCVRILLLKQENYSGRIRKCTIFLLHKIAKKT